MKKDNPKKTRNSFALRLFAASTAFFFAFAYAEPIGPLFSQRSSGGFISKPGKWGVKKLFNFASVGSNTCFTGYLVKKFGKASLKFGGPALVASAVLATASKKLCGKRDTLFKYPYHATVGLSYATWFLSQGPKKLLQKWCPVFTNKVRTILNKTRTAKACNFLKKSGISNSALVKFMRKSKVSSVIYGLSVALGWTSYAYRAINKWSHQQTLTPEQAI